MIVAANAEMVLKTPTNLDLWNGCVIAWLLSEEIPLGVGPMDRGMANRAILRADRSLIMRSAWKVTVKFHSQDLRMTFKTELPD